MSVQAVFDKYASQYDDSRKKLIPCFDDFYQTAIDIIPFTSDQDIHVLDLGSGTGLMASLVASNFPLAKITLFDVAGKMLEEAKKVSPVIQIHSASGLRIIRGRMHSIRPTIS